MLLTRHKNQKSQMDDEKGTRRRRPANQAGFMMISALVSISIVSSAIIAGLLGISTASRLTVANTLNSTASGLASSQIDLIRDAEFVPTPGQYASVSVPDGFTISNTTAALPGGDSAVQEVTVSVSHEGEVVDQIVIIKANR